MKEVHGCETSCVIERDKAKDEPVGKKINNEIVRILHRLDVPTHTHFTSVSSTGIR
jgi:hypothetical protein